MSDMSRSAVESDQSIGSVSHPISMEFLIRFVQIHESFRRPEIEALAALIGIDVEFLVYNECVCLAIVEKHKLKKKTRTAFQFGHGSIISRDEKIFLIHL